MYVDEQMRSHPSPMEISVPSMNVERHAAAAETVTEKRVVMRWCLLTGSTPSPKRSLTG